MYDRLIADWNALAAASAVMTAGPFPAWPWSGDMDAFLAQQRRRDAVQGKGMRFADGWRQAAPVIVALVAARPADFPEYHVKPKKGDPLDPTAYAQAQAIMPRIIALRDAGAI